MPFFCEQLCAWMLNILLKQVIYRNAWFRAILWYCCFFWLCLKSQNYRLNGSFRQLVCLALLRFQTKNISLSWEFISYCKALFFPRLCIEVVISFFPAVTHLYWRLGKLAVVWAIQCGQYRDLYSHHSVQGPDSITHYQGSAAQWSAEASKDLIQLGKNNMSNLNCCLFMN